MSRLKPWVRLTDQIRRQQSGIGLPETLVAIAILGLSAVGFISSLSVGAGSVKTLDEQAIAQQLLTSQIETVQSEAYDAGGDSYSIIAAPPGYAVTLDVDSHIYADEDIQKISVTVWHQGTEVASLEKYKGNR